MVAISITVHDFPEEIYRALRERAIRNGHSTEAEILDILKEAIRLQAPLNIGSELAALGKAFGGIELDITRDKTPAKSADFE